MTTQLNLNSTLPGFCSSLSRSSSPEDLGSSQESSPLGSPVRNTTDVSESLLQQFEASQINSLSQSLFLNTTLSDANDVFGLAPQDAPDRQLSPVLSTPVITSTPAPTLIPLPFPTIFSQPAFQAPVATSTLNPFNLPTNDNGIGTGLNFIEPSQSSSSGFDPAPDFFSTSPINFFDQVAQSHSDWTQLPFISNTPSSSLTPSSSNSAQVSSLTPKQACKAALKVLKKVSDDSKKIPSKLEDVLNLFDSSVKSKFLKKVASELDVKEKKVEDRLGKKKYRADNLKAVRSVLKQLSKDFATKEFLDMRASAKAQYRA